MNDRTLRMALKALTVFGCLAITGLIILGFSPASPDQDAEATRTALAGVIAGSVGAIAGVMAQGSKTSG